MKHFIKNRKIWIDLDNSPHVPFFTPIVHELEEKGYTVLVTARDCSQTCGLADMFGLNYRRIGRHYGKSKPLKVAGTVYRALQLAKKVGTEEPALAVSHGSRAQMIAALLMRIPSITIMDYEHVKGFVKPTWVMMPELISTDSVKHSQQRILKYPGIKEDVYVPSFKADPKIREKLGIKDDELVVTIRPPATEAHYHNPESEALFSEVINFLSIPENLRMVILPRNDNQKEMIKNKWARQFSSGRIIVPEQVVDGLNLLWNSDLVISGGGTMNREAAALGIPVYSIFRGKIGAVDLYLSEKGKLVLLEKPEEIRKKLVIKKRQQTAGEEYGNNVVLKSVVGHILKILAKE